MSKTTLKGNLSKNSFDKLSKQVKEYKTRLNKGFNLGIKEATEKLYDLIIEKCIENNITIHYENIFMEYDEIKKIGRVYSNDEVIVLNEFGSGIKGTQDEWANKFGYQVNLSGKGKEGWKFYNQEHGYGGITHGIPSKHMFYEALKEIEKELAKDVQISIDKTIGKWY